MSTADGGHRSLSPLRFISVEAASGLVLLGAAALALLCANSPLAPAYHGVWQQQIGFGTALLAARDLHYTMSIFIADLAFHDSRLLTAAKFAVLLASAVAAVLALILGRLRSSPQRSSN